MPHIPSRGDVMKCSDLFIGPPIVRRALDVLALDQPFGGIRTEIEVHMVLLDPLLQARDGARRGRGRMLAEYGTSDLLQEAQDAKRPLRAALFQTIT